MTDTIFGEEQPNYTSTAKKLGYTTRPLLEANTQKKILVLIFSLPLIFLTK